MSSLILRVRRVLQSVAVAVLAVAILAAWDQHSIAQPPPKNDDAAAKGQPPKGKEAEPKAGGAAAEVPAELAKEEEPEEPAGGGAKQYQQLPVEKVGLTLNDVSRMLREGVPAGQEQAFDDFFRKSLLPQWTLPENYPRLPDLRQRLRGSLAMAKGPGAHDRLNRLLLDFLGNTMAKGDFHPAVRFNAMLLIGELNARPTDTGQTAQPLPDALPVLLGAMEDEKLIDAVRFAALKGVIRHGMLGISDEASKTSVSAAMLRLATSREAPGRSREGHAWMRCRAIELLAHFKSPGQDGAVAKAMVAILDEPEVPFSVRLAAASALGELDLNAQLGLPPAEITRALGRLARDACKDEIQLCEAHERILDPRKLKSRLVPVRVGLTGSEQAVSEPTGGVGKLIAQASDKDKELFKKVREQIDAWIAKLDDKDLTTKPEPAAGPMDMPPAMGTGGRDAARDGPMAGMMGPRMGNPAMGMGGPMMGGAGETPKTDTAAQIASKRILDEIKADLEKFEPRLESSAE